MVLDGRVRVNGDVVQVLPILVDVNKDKIEVDGDVVRIKDEKVAKKVYVLLNKPTGVFCTNVAQGEQKRAIDLLPPDFPYRVYSVGRLDAESRGLLLLTNDGELTNELTHPRYGVVKSYLAEIDGYIEGAMVDELNHGIWLADKKGQSFKTQPSRVKIIKRARDRSTLEITIHEGRNRQIRRMLASLGHKVTKLTRITMGRLTLKGVGPGHWRFLTALEVKELVQEVAKGKKETELVGEKTGIEAKGGETVARPVSRRPLIPRPLSTRGKKGRRGGKAGKVAGR